MPIEMGLWKIGTSGPAPVGKALLESEAHLEGWVAENPSLLGDDVLIFGRQVITAHGGRIDLLALDVDGFVHIIELKRDKTPRDVIAQTLDYASWVVGLTLSELDDICKTYREVDLATAYRERFGSGLPENVTARRHKMMIVASALDPSSERIVQYLALHHGLDINALFFTVFRDGDADFLGRSWLISPDEVDRAEARVERKTAGEWTGYYFVNVGESDMTSEGRSWEDCVRYGFISGGQGERYRRAMTKLESGDQIFAYINGRGYVGFGIVTSPAVMAKDFRASDGSQLLANELQGTVALSAYLDDDINAEYVVGVDWQKTFDRGHAQTYAGIFANQNIVCKIRDSRTIAFLAERFGLAGVPSA